MTEIEAKNLASHLVAIVNGYVISVKTEWDPKKKQESFYIAIKDGK
jgi:hypothetical protein